MQGRIKLSTTPSEKRGATTGLDVALCCAALALFAFVLLRTAWLCDDAYITFRTVNNAVNGYGFTWNVVERVQVYTHPLWMLLLTAFHFFTREMYATALFVSMGVSFLAVAVLAFRVAAPGAPALFAVLALLSAKAFVDYSTSGLENPLTHLLLALFMWVYFSERPPLAKVLPMSFIMALGLCNRMDTLLLFAPAMAVVALEARTWKAFALGALGALPFVGWEIFSVIYYGFPLPNTAYAKLNNEIPALALFLEGFGHIVSMLVWMPLSLALFLGGVVSPAFTRNWRALPLAFGAIIYALYFMKVGGDFMAGRFLSAPIFIGVALLSRVPMRYGQALPAIVLVVFLGLCGPYPSLTSGKNYGYERIGSSMLPFRDARQVSDHRGTFYAATGLLRAKENGWEIAHPWAKMGEREKNRGIKVSVHGAIGYLGFYAGPKVYVIDYYALGDPLLARIPYTQAFAFRSGHFPRKLPAGYKESVESGENKIIDKNLAEYYGKLALITRGPVFSEERLKAVWEMNLGRYDHWMDAYAGI